MQNDISHILISREEIASRVNAVAHQIIQDITAIASRHATTPPQPPALTIVPILTGSMIFVADLIRQLPFFLQIELISVSSYAGATTTPGELRIMTDLESLDLAARHVLVVDDIFDSGQTLASVTHSLARHNPASMNACVLLRKQRANPRPVKVNYACFDIPDEFVVGYGLDYNGYYRNLPDIAVLTPQAISRHAIQAEP